MEKDTTPIAEGLDRVTAYSYLLEWEWPDHIESLLRKLLFMSLTEATSEDTNEEVSGEITDLDRLGAQLAWLISVYPKSNPAILHALALQQPAAFVERIAENPNVLPETLANLAEHPSARVRAAVAENPRTPEEVLLTLIHDESVDVRYAMAENHNLPELTLQLLTEDENCYVSARASRTLCRKAPAEPAILPLRRTQTQSAPLRRAAQM